MQQQQQQQQLHLKCWAGNKGGGEEGDGGGDSHHHRVTRQDSSSKSEPLMEILPGAFFSLAVNSLFFSLAVNSLFKTYSILVSKASILSNGFLPVTYFEMTTPERRMPTTEERAFVKPPEFPGTI